MNRHARLLFCLSALAGCSDDPASLPNTAYVGLFGDDAVAVIDLDAKTVIATIGVSTPDGLVITPDGAKVYVSSTSAGTVDVIATATNQVVKHIDVGAQPQGLTITPDGKHVLVSVQGAGTATLVDTATDAVTASPAIARAHNSAISSDGTLGFVASQDTPPAVDIVALPAGTMTASLPVDKAPRAVAEQNHKLYVTVSGSNDIEVIDATTGALGTPITTGGSPHDIRATIDNRSLLTVSQTANDLEVIDPSSSAVTGHIATGVAPHWIGLSSDGASAYVTNETDGTLTVIDLATKAVTATFNVGKTPRKLAIAP